jgi:hypothetical protein
MLGLIAFAAAATAPPPPAPSKEEVFAALRPMIDNIQSHWQPVCNAAQPTRMKVRLLLDANGNLAAKPTVLVTANPSPGNEQAIIDAVTQAAPFGPLPVRDIILNFDTAQRCSVRR